MALRAARRPRVGPRPAGRQASRCCSNPSWPAPSRGGTSILFAALGETVAERSGVINLGTEGSMLCGALAAYAVGIETGNPWLGVLAGSLAGALLAAVHAVMVLQRGANQIATGLVVTFLGIGLTALFGQDYVGQGVDAARRPGPIPGLSRPARSSGRSCSTTTR